jgi:O-antigen/teichoic acid export membrane protein
LILANTAYGIFNLLGVYLAQPFWPEPKMRWKTIREPVDFGLKVVGSHVLAQLYRNVDYLLVGRFLGLGPLGVYRATFEIAMSPAIAVLNVVNRTAFPVFARIAADRQELKRAFLWNLHSLGLLLAPVIAVLCLCADDILLAVGKPQWLAAADGVRILALAALLRSFAQSFSMVFHAAGRPAYALYDSAWSLVVLVIAILIALTTSSPANGVTAVCYAWLLGYPLMFTLLWWLTLRIVPLRLADVLRCLREPTFGLFVAALGPLAVIGLRAYIPSARMRLGLEIAATLAMYLLYLRFSLGIRPRDIVKPRPQQAAVAS